MSSSIFRSYNPGRALTPPVWAPPLSLTTTRGIIVIFSSSAYLDVSVQRVGLSIDGTIVPGCPIRTSADQWLFAPPRGFSQLITSFVASESQGILHTPLVTSLVILLVCIFALVLLFRLLHYVIELAALQPTVKIVAPSPFPAHVEDTGFEPVTPCLQSRCSSQLS